MLKIKDNIDLDILLKFKFKKEKTRYYIKTARDLMMSELYGVFPKKKVLAISIDIKTRKITCTKNIVCKNDQTRIDILFDLINAGFVEKIDV